MDAFSGIKSILTKPAIRPVFPNPVTYFRTRLLEKLEKAKEEKRRRLEATSTATSTGSFTAQARKSSVS